MYLNVTDLTTYNVAHDSFCVRWTPHRAATSYRLKINPFDSEYHPSWRTIQVTGHKNVGFFYHAP